MPTNLAIDDKLITEALRWGNHKTKKEAVNQALDFYIRAKRRKGILSLAGSIKATPNYNYKKERKSR